MTTPWITGDVEDIQALARSVADGKIAPHAAAVDEEARFPEEGYRALVESGLHALAIPESYGGPGAGALTGAVVSEEIARVCATTQQVAGANDLFTWPLLLAGTEEQRRRWLEPVAFDGELGAFALSEPDAGSDVSALSTSAEPEGDGWRVRGTKRWITNAGRARCCILFARVTGADSSGISAFVLDTEDSGISYGAPERKMGLRGSPTREMYLDDVRLSADRLIGRVGEGIRIALATLDRTRIGVAAQAVGIAQGALDVAASYVTARRQFDQPLADFQGVQFKLADMVVAIRAARLLTHAAAVELDASTGTHPEPSAGAAAKLFASDTAMSVTTDAVQLLGGSGYVRDFPVERMMRDAKITQIYEGTNEIQRVVIARQLTGGRESKSSKRTEGCAG